MKKKAFKNLSKESLITKDTVIKVLESIGNGVDPSSEKVFPAQSCAHNPAIIRACLNLAAELRSTPAFAGRKKRSKEETRRINAQQGRAKNSHVKWTRADEENAINQFNSRQSIDDIANNLGRSALSVVSKLKRLGLVDEAFAKRYQKRQ